MIRMYLENKSKLYLVCDRCNNICEMPAEMMRRLVARLRPSR